MIDNTRPNIRWFIWLLIKSFGINANNSVTLCVSVDERMESIVYFMVVDVASSSSNRLLQQYMVV